MNNTGRLRRFTMLIGTVVIATMVAGACSTSPPKASADGVASTSNPVRASTGGTRNVTFYYGGTTPLEPGADLTKLGKPAIVVATGRANDADQVNAIHSIGAKAYRYLQFYWAPDDSEYEGINLNEHPDWAFCRSRTEPLLGRITDGGARRWFFIDANETAVRARLTEVLAGIKADGWDGVMFDRGAAATQYATDYFGDYNWNRRSSCTQSPHEPGATFSDAYVNMLGLAHEVGLQAMMNNGRSPFDPVTPMRPDPADTDCKTAASTNCTTLPDAWSHLDLVLNETAAKPQDMWWSRTFIGNRRSERNASYGGRTVAMITTASLGGDQFQTRANVFYQWSRIKLFDLPVAVNTGDDRCPGATGPCNRYGAYPTLVNTTFGAPLAAGPVSRGCLRGDKIRCVWQRTYSDGLNILNVSPRRRSGLLVRLGTDGCRYVYDVYRDQPMADNRCVRAVSLNLPAWRGLPLKYSSTPW